MEGWSGTQHRVSRKSQPIDYIFALKSRMKILGIHLGLHIDLLFVSMYCIMDI